MKQYLLKSNYLKFKKRINIILVFEFSFYYFPLLINEETYGDYHIKIDKNNLKKLLTFCL